MGFSHKQACLDAIATEIRRAKTMALSATNKTFVAQHPDWVREAQKKDFTNLTKECKERMEKQQHLARDRIKRTHGHPEN